MYRIILNVEILLFNLLYNIILFSIFFLFIIHYLFIYHIVYFIHGGVITNKNGRMIHFIWCTGRAITNKYPFITSMIISSICKLLNQNLICSLQVW